MTNIIKFPDHRREAALEVLSDELFNFAFHKSDGDFALAHSAAIRAANALGAMLPDFEPV